MWRWWRRLFEVTGGEKQVEPGEDLLNPLECKAPDLFDQLVFINGEDLGDVDHALLGQIRFALVEKNVARSLPRFRLEVIAQTTTVAIRLRLKTLFWTTTCGWR
jgi:hypothetical protein